MNTVHLYSMAMSSALLVEMGLLQIINQYEFLTLKLIGMILIYTAEHVDVGPRAYLF